MKKLLILCLFFPAVTFADRQTGYITGYVPTFDGEQEVFIFKLEDNVIDGCNTTGRYAIGSASATYNTIKTSVVAAFHGKAKVTVEYDGSCDVWSNSFDATRACFGTINC